MATNITQFPETASPEAVGRFVIPPAARPNPDNLVTETDEPVDNLVSEKLMRLLVEPLYASFTPPGGGPFVAAADVGIFMTDHEEGIAPDVMVILDINLHPGWHERDQRSYFVWLYGKVPDLVLEIVSNRTGGEDSTKLREYAARRIPYYVVYDPFNCLRAGELRAWCLHGRTYVPVSPSWFPELGLGLTFWEGTFEHEGHRWLRWCDRDGVVLPTGLERAETERQRAETERQRAETAAAAVEQQRQRLEQLEALLRQQGLEPPR